MQTSPESRPSLFPLLALLLVVFLAFVAGFLVLVGLSIDATEPLKPAEQEVKRG